MQISIIIPIYKVEKYLRECLESIKTQNFQDYEVLMINDGSPDNSEVICKEFAAGDARFKYIRQENQGVSAARNKGLSQARGKYVYFMDPDDTFSPDFLEALYNEAEAGGADIVLNNSVLIGLSPRKVLQLKDIPNGCYDADIRNYFVDGYLWYKLFRKETIDRAQIAFLPGCRFREDELFGMMFYPYCRKFSVIRQGYYYYRQHGESALASVLKNRKAYSETIARNLETIFRFYKERGLDEYFPIALRLLPYFHEWHNPRHYWQTMQQLNMHLDLEKWRDSLPIHLRLSLLPQSYPAFRLRMFWLYGSGELKKIRKQMLSVKLSKKHKLIRILGITLLEKDNWDIKNKKIA